MRQANYRKRRINPELKELRRRVEEYETLLLRYRKAMHKPSWEEGESLDEVETKVLYAGTSIFLERGLFERKAKRA